ncbi:DUF4355 domain-containing protein [Bacillus cereus]|uniref:capsid assembly scaffolding protein Gp46 family protein n=1 Tax=Bacillus cereus group TaxID=86661 RepID=UPI00044E3BF8|nr:MULTISPECIES: DUF4355 domain-containing protein [Bacillus cereus group]EXY06183.1 hypothetical protein BF15_24680 [Bacillus thuringiensis]MEB8632245.1 DUF4355 domain-containing protein [Bacillus cereus]MEB8746562.1 DUF4355 domain-containing protein [Bacillus cereus]MEB8756037.1 DUF4355 domain-containing protein [Bacillus cereus]MEB8798166.1 DUF4355 domain-containing protein [Bacillus cereus]
MFKKEQETQYRLRVKGLQHFSDPEPNGGGDPEPTPAGGEPEFTLEHFQRFLDTNVDAQKILQSRVDSGVSKGVESYRTNTVPELIQKEIAKRTEKTPEQIEMESMKAEIEKMKAENTRKTIETEVAKQADKLGIDADFALTFCVDPTSLDNTLKNVTKFNEYTESLVAERVQKSVDERFANNYAKGADLTLPKTNETGNTSSLAIIQQQLSKQQ